MFEHHTDPLLPRARFLLRAFWFFFLSASVVATALGVGVLGYHYLGGLAWIDSLLNASMILGGMGPVDQITTRSGKLFASFYALFSGLLFIGAISLLLTPFVHRLMHTLHVEDE
ncbi:MAG: hypothetical protein KGR24_09515 [Planctomycetes bacterium]|nr:hypothetical protein [Planctomycetota bacterium]